MFLVSICRLGILGPAVELRHLRYFVAVGGDGKRLARGIETSRLPTGA